MRSAMWTVSVAALVFGSGTRTSYAEKSEPSFIFGTQTSAWTTPYRVLDQEQAHQFDLKSFG